MANTGDNRCVLCIDLKSFYASVECADRGLDPFQTNLVVADPDRSANTICLAVTPAMKALGVKNRCRVRDIPVRRQIPQVMVPKIGHADRRNEPFGLQTLKYLPRFPIAALDRPMDKKQVEPVDAERRKRLLA